jgi:hypothetical protein
VWDTYWDGAAADVGYSLTQMNDGGYVITGTTFSFGSSGEAFIAKFNSSRTFQWDKVWGALVVDTQSKVIETNDNNILVMGSTDSFSSLNDVFLAKFDSTGTLLWDTVWDGGSSDFGYGVVETSDGSLVVSGANNGKLLLAKFDSSGTLVWDTTWSGINSEAGNDIIETSDGGFAVTGQTSSFGAGGQDIVLVKFTSSGSVSWDATWGGTSTDVGNGVTQTSDGGYAVLGTSSSTGGAGNDDFVLLKYDSSGAISGCSSPTCQNPSPTIGSPSVTPSDPSASVSDPSASSSNPSATLTSITLTKNVSVAINPTGIDVGSTLAALNTAATAPAEGTIFRLRLGLHVGGSQLDPAAVSFKLQYALKGGAGSCSAASPYAVVSDSSVIRYADNANAGSGLSLTTNANDPTHSSDTLVRQSYLETGTTTFTSQTAVSVGQDGIWDVALKTYHALAGDTYCLRVVKSDNSTLNTYTVYPEITMPAATFSQAAYRWYNAEQTSSTFAKAWGGTGADTGSSVIQTSDGGYAVTGTTSSFGAGAGDMFIAKYDSTGALIWDQTWGGSGAENGAGIIQTSDGGFVVTGGTYTYGVSGSQDMFVVKYDSTGAFVWNKTWGGGFVDAGTAITGTSDGGFAVTGITTLGDGADSPFIAKYNSSGTLSWNAVPEFSNGSANSIVQTSDGGYAIAGWYGFNGNGDNQSFFAKFDSSGVTVFSKTWGNGAMNSDGQATGVIQTSDGGYALTGWSDSYGAGQYDVYLAKYNSSGVLSWDKTWGGTGADLGYDVIQTADGGYALGGNTGSFGGGVLIKYNSSGTLQWNKTWSGGGYNSLVQTIDGGYSAVASTASYGAGGSDMALLKFDSSGDLAGCTISDCTSPSATTTSPSSAGGSVSATDTNPTATISTPSASSSSPSATDTVILAGSIGSPITTLNSALDFVSHRKPVTLKVAVATDTSGIAISSQAFKLQFASKGSNASCAAVSAGSYADVTSGTALKYYDDTRYTAGSAIGSDVDQPTDGSRTMSPQAYQESNNFTNSSSAIYAGEDGIWQFMLTVDGASYQGASYCIRVATSGGTQLSATNIAEIKVNPDMSRLLRGGNSFDLQGRKNKIAL